MIEVELIKTDVYMGKVIPKTWKCVTVEKAYARRDALVTLHRCRPEQVSEHRTDSGNLQKIVIDLSDSRTSTSKPEPALPATTPSGVPVPSDEVASENEECARIVDQILGENNKISVYIRNRMAARTIAKLHQEGIAT